MNFYSIAKERQNKGLWNVSDQGRVGYPDLVCASQSRGREPRNDLPH